jgi:hypothetical protein
MKKIVIVLIIILCLTPLAMPVIAAKEDTGVHAGITIGAARTQEPSSGEQEKKQGDDGAAATTVTIRETPEREQLEKESGAGAGTQTRERTIAEVRENYNESHENLNATLRNVSPSQRERIKNENEVRLAVRTMLEMENLNGGIGPNISAIAREFNNSASSAWTFEERIQNRNTFIRLLFGGDRDAAQNLANLTLRNQARIVEMNQLMSSEPLDPEVRAMMEEQIRIMQQEQERLEQLSKREQEDRGFLGWFG